MRVRPYILAGGRSSRMGRDKAMLSLGGKTLLARAVETLRAVPLLSDNNNQVIVTIVGERTSLEGADRVIADGYPGCGPLGGIEAALCDLNREGRADWAFFLPVDMPFLSAGLVDAFLGDWLEATRRGAKVCYVVVDEKPQPLVSLLHKSVHGSITEALTVGQFKVTPVLESAAEAVAPRSTDGISYGNSPLHKICMSFASPSTPLANFIATGEQQALRRLWFSNVNNEEDFREAETSAATLGSTCGEAHNS